MWSGRLKHCGTDPQRHSRTDRTNQVRVTTALLSAPAPTHLGPRTPATHTLLPVTRSSMYLSRQHRLRFRCVLIQDNGRSRLPRHPSGRWGATSPWWNQLNPIGDLRTCEYMHSPPSEQGVEGMHHPPGPTSTSHMSYERSCLDHPTTSTLPLQRTSGGYVQPEEQGAPAGHRGEQRQQHSRHPPGYRHVHDHNPRKPRAGEHDPEVVHRVHHTSDQVIRNTSSRAGGPRAGKLRAGEQGFVDLIGVQHRHGKRGPERAKGRALARPRQPAENDQFASSHPDLHGRTAPRVPARRGSPALLTHPEPAPRAHCALTLRGKCASAARTPPRETAVRTARPLNGPSGGRSPTRGRPRCLPARPPERAGLFPPHRGRPTRHTGILAGTTSHARP